MQVICITSSRCHPVVSCFIGLTFLVLAYSGCPGKEAIKWVSVSLISQMDSSQCFGAICSGSGSAECCHQGGSVIAYFRSLQLSSVYFALAPDCTDRGTRV